MRYVKTALVTIGRRDVERHYPLLTERERQDLLSWHAEWVIDNQVYEAGDWPGWARVLARLDKVHRARATECAR